MTSQPPSYRGYRFPPEIISHAVWLYYRFGYNGTRPENAGIWDRANVAVYGDVDVHGVDNEWSLGAAVRIEDFYDSFGTTMNSKLSGRYAFTDAFAVRAGVSSGFRTPTPGQQNVLNVTTEFDYEIGDLINNGTIPSTSPVAALRNGAPLQPSLAGSNACPLHSFVCGWCSAWFLAPSSCTASSQ